MRILLIGKSHLKLRGKRHAFYDTRLYNGLVRNNHWVYFFSPKEEEKLAFSFGMEWLAKHKAQQSLFDVVKTIEPDVLIYSGETDVIRSSATKRASAGMGCALR